MYSCLTSKRRYATPKYQILVIQPTVEKSTMNNVLSHEETSHKQITQYNCETILNLHLSNFADVHEDINTRVNS